MRLRYTSYIVALVTGLAAGDGVNFDPAEVFNPTGAGCVDSAGFVSCLKTQETNRTACHDACSKLPTQNNVAQYCNIGCDLYDQPANLGCWVQSCWNKLYSCEYQQTAINYFAKLGLVQGSGIVPHFPAPDSASAGACSCNIGYVQGNMTNILQNENVNYCDPWNDIYNNPGFAQDLADCTCCKEALPLSNILDICPKSDLSWLDITSFIQDELKLRSSGASNCTNLESAPSACVSKYSIPFIGTVYDVASLPTGIPGTEALTNTPGDAFTDFGGSVLTLVLGASYSSVITGAPYKAQVAATGTATKAATTAAAAGGKSSSVTGQGTASATSSGGASASTTTKASVAGKNDVMGWAAWGMLVLGGGLVCFL